MKLSVGMMLEKYVEPILNYLGYFVKDMLIVPKGNEDGHLTIERIDKSRRDGRTVDKDIVVVKTDDEWAQYKDMVNAELFNPFANPDHANVLCFLTVQYLEAFYHDDEDVMEADLGIYDDDGDSKVIIEEQEENGFDGTTRYRMCLSKVNPNGTTKELFTGTHENRSLAMWLACVDLYRHELKRHESYFDMPDLACREIEGVLESAKAEMKRVREILKQKEQYGVFKADDFSDEMDFSDDDFLDCEVPIEGAGFHKDDPDFYIADENGDGFLLPAKHISIDEYEKQVDEDDEVEERDKDKPNIFDGVDSMYEDDLLL